MTEIWEPGGRETVEMIGMPTYHNRHSDASSSAFHYAPSVTISRGFENTSVPSSILVGWKFLALFAINKGLILEHYRRSAPITTRFTMA